MVRVTIKGREYSIDVSKEEIRDVVSNEVREVTDDILDLYDENTGRSVEDIYTDALIAHIEAVGV